MSEPKTGSVRPTLASLKDELEQLGARVAEVAESGHSHPAASDLETSVAGRCARALGELTRADRDSSASASLGSYTPRFTGGSYDYQPLYVGPVGPVARVLDYLRQRHGLPDPSHEARRLSAELERAYERLRELEGRLDQVRGATS